MGLGEKGCRIGFCGLVERDPNIGAFTDMVFIGQSFTILFDKANLSLRSHAVVLQLREVGIWKVQKMDRVLR